MKGDYNVRVNLNVPAQTALNSSSGDIAGKTNLHLSFHPAPHETSILAGMYANLNRVKSVTIPENITYIDTHAFANCKNLSHVKFEGHSIPKIHPDAFTGCSLKNAGILKPNGKQKTKSVRVKNKIHKNKSDEGKADQ